MGDVFYRIWFQDKYYVGELADGTAPNMWEFHANQCYPWATPHFDDNSGRWEKILRDSLINDGFKTTFAPILLFQLDYGAAVDALKQSMSQYIGSHNNPFYSTGSQMYDDIYRLFALDSAGSQYANIRIPEMLLILITKNIYGDVWNTHCNYGARVVDINEILSAKTLMKRRDESSGKIAIWYSFNMKEVPSWLEQQLVGVKHTKNNYIQFNVNNSKNRKALQQINHVVRNTTMSSLIYRLTTLRDLCANSQEQKQKDLSLTLDRAINELSAAYGYTAGPKKTSPGTITTHKQLRTLINDLNKIISEDTQKQIFYESKDILEQKTAIWRDWIKSASDIFFPPFDKEPVELRYKEKFTKVIQSRCFPEVQDPEYQNWKMDYTVTGNDEQSTKQIKKEKGTWLESPDRLYMNPGAFYPKFLELNNREWDGTSLCNKTRSYITDLGQYITTNWDYIYGEQVAYYLTQHGYNFTYTKNAKISNGFVNQVSTPAAIEWY